MRTDAVLEKRRRQGYLRRLNSTRFPASPSAGIIQIRFDGRPAITGTSQLASASSRSPFNYTSLLAARSELVNSLLSFSAPQAPAHPLTEIQRLRKVRALAPAAGARVSAGFILEARGFTLRPWAHQASGLCESSRGQSRQPHSAQKSVTDSRSLFPPFGGNRGTPGLDRGRGNYRNPREFRGSDSCAYVPGE